MRIWHELQEEQLRQTALSAVQVELIGVLIRVSQEALHVNFVRAKF